MERGVLFILISEPVFEYPDRPWRCPGPGTGKQEFAVRNVLHPTTSSFDMKFKDFLDSIINFSDAGHDSITWLVADLVLDQLRGVQ